MKNIEVTFADTKGNEYKRTVAAKNDHDYALACEEIIHSDLSDVAIEGYSPEAFNTVKIKVKKLRTDAVIPQHGSEYSAGYDLFAAIDAPVEIPPHETVKIGTGLAMSFDDGWFAGIFSRSGIATKEGLRPANCVGVCDSDYRGEYIVAVHNDSNAVRTVTPGEKIAQMILLPCTKLTFVETDELDETFRGEGGFGSTGNTALPWDTCEELFLPEQEEQQSSNTAAPEEPMTVESIFKYIQEHQEEIPTSVKTQLVFALYQKERKKSINSFYDDALKAQEERDSAIREKNELLAALKEISVLYGDCRFCVHKHDGKNVCSDCDYDRLDRWKWSGINYGK